MRTLLVVILLAGVPVAAASAEPEDASLVQLIATPERFDGKHVRVVGYCWLEFEGNGLYLHRDDYLHGISRNGVWLNLTERQRLTPEKWRGKYVLVEGTFRAEDRGHMGMFAGSLDLLNRLEVWSEPKMPRHVSPPPKPTGTSRPKSDR